MAKKLKFILKSSAPKEFEPLPAQEREISHTEPTMMGSVSQSTLNIKQIPAKSVTGPQYENSRNNLVLEGILNGEGRFNTIDTNR